MITTFFLIGTCFFLVCALVMLFADLDAGVAFMIAAIICICGTLVSVIWDEVDNPRKGTVIGKEFVAEHMGMCGKVPCRIGDRWFLTLRDGNNEGTITVDKGEFDRSPIGSHFTAQ
jgi:hypothetical protein